MGKSDLLMAMPKDETLAKAHCCHNKLWFVVMSKGNNCICQCTANKEYGYYMLFHSS